MLYDQVSNDIKEAMKARDKVRLETLRNIKKVFIEAKTAPGANDTLEDAAALKILAKLAKQGKESAETFKQQNREDLAQRPLHFAIVDEVDSILIDEARTPLIISGARGESADTYKKADAFVRSLKKYVLDEAEKDYQEQTQDANIPAEYTAARSTL